MDALYKDGLDAETWAQAVAWANKPTSQCFSGVVGGLKRQDVGRWGLTYVAMPR